MNRGSDPEASDANVCAIQEKSCPLPPVISLPCLKNLTIDARYSMNGSPAPEILSAVVKFISTGSPSITSFTLKLSDRNIVVGEPFIEEMLGIYGSSLERLSFISCGVTIASVSVIARRCKKLKRLEVSVPFKETVSGALLDLHYQLVNTHFARADPIC